MVCIFVTSLNHHKESELFFACCFFGVQRERVKCNAGPPAAEQTHVNTETQQDSRGTFVESLSRSSQHHDKQRTKGGCWTRASRSWSRLEGRLRIDGGKETQHRAALLQRTVEYRM